MTAQLIFAVILVFLAAILLVVSASSMYQLTSSDAAGNGLAQAFTAFATIGLWVVILILMIWVASTSLTPRWFHLTSILLLVPGSAAASLAVQSLLSDREPVQWMIPGPAMVAPAFYIGICFWTLVLRRPLEPAWPAGCVLFCMSLSLLVPWPRLIRQPEVKRQRIARYYEEIEQAKARLEQLHPDSPVREWAQVATMQTAGTEDLRTQAFDAIRAHPRKAEGIAQMLRDGDATLLPYLWNLELDDAAAARVCGPARDLLLAKAKDLRPRPGRNRFALVRTEADALVSTVQWLSRRDPCHAVDDVIAALRSMAEAYPDHSGEAALFLADLRRAATSGAP
jgi:hypothetical protein